MDREPLTHARAHTHTHLSSSPSLAALHLSPRPPGDSPSWGDDEGGPQTTSKGCHSELTPGSWVACGDRTPARATQAAVSSSPRSSPLRRRAGLQYSPPSARHSQTKQWSNVIASSSISSSMCTIILCIFILKCLFSIKYFFKVFFGIFYISKFYFKRGNPITKNKK